VNTQPTESGDRPSARKLCGLLGLVEREYLDGPPVEGDDALTARLGLGALGCPTELDDLLAHDQRRCAQVEVLPAQPHGLTTP
jgi:hypothetical protein